eukprot:m.206706 g.206706  ORF g.206706 m.206706 type:complete len:309 (+) comp15434_c0_seq1:2334-3260(+)
MRPPSNRTKFTHVILCNEQSTRRPRKFQCPILLRVVSCRFCYRLANLHYVRDLFFREIGPMLGVIRGGGAREHTHRTAHPSGVDRVARLAQKRGEYFVESRAQRFVPDKEGRVLIAVLVDKGEPVGVVSVVQVCHLSNVPVKVGGRGVATPSSQQVRPPLRLFGAVSFDKRPRVSMICKGQKPGSECRPAGPRRCREQTAAQNIINRVPDGVNPEVSFTKQREKITASLVIDCGNVGLDDNWWELVHRERLWGAVLDSNAVGRAGEEVGRRLHSAIVLGMRLEGSGEVVTPEEVEKVGIRCLVEGSSV